MKDEAYNDAFIALLYYQTHCKIVNVCLDHVVLSLISVSCTVHLCCKDITGELVCFLFSIEILLCDEYCNAVTQHSVNSVLSVSMVNLK